MTPLKSYLADWRYLVELAGTQAGFQDPVAVELDALAHPLLSRAQSRTRHPIGDALIRDWDPDAGRSSTGVHFGMCTYIIEGIRLVAVVGRSSQNRPYYHERFYVVDRGDYLKLYRLALRYHKMQEGPTSRPILDPEQADVLWRNTIGYLDRNNLRAIRKFGGRPKRGILLTGEPGNGKTMACRWIWEECRRRNWLWRLITPDLYKAARQSCDPDASVRHLFSLESRGIIFFDDMDIALRDRETVQETDDQAVFLGALDGLQVKEGVVFVFTTNCSLDLIDRAFKRPGRLDVVLRFEAPPPELRRRLFDTWCDEIVTSMDLDRCVRETEGYSFAELDELRNLMILDFLDSNEWSWDRALEQFAINRSDFSACRKVGFTQEAIEV